jgi:hypothetical protein
MSDGCRGLAAVIEQREAFGIVALSQKTDEAALSEVERYACIKAA